MTTETTASGPEHKQPATKPDSTLAVLAELDGWHPNANDLDRLYSLSRASLDEVKQLTHYEDEKASRLLTAVAFLSALAGGIYAGVVSKGVLHRWFQLPCHVLFFLFAAAIVIGAGKVIHAIKPRFNTPTGWRGKPKSFLFALKIVESSPTEWAKAFTTVDAAKLKEQYIKNHIHETYLVAEKLLVKLKPLDCGMSWFSSGIIVLVAWVILVAIGAICQSFTPCSNANEGAVVIFTDADNTLWDTNGLYAAAQRAMLAHVEDAVGKRASGDPVEVVRRVDQRIAKNHPQGLRYPPQLLVRGLIDELVGSTTQATTGTSKPVVDDKFIEAEAARYLETINGIPELREGVKLGLERLRRENFPIVILTEGSETAALKRLNHHGLLTLVDHVVELRKSPESYKQVAQQFGPHAKLYFMIGDQIDRDIQFAGQAGFRTVYYPGGFTPAWLPDVGTVKPDHQIASYDQAPEAIHGLIKDHRSINSSDPR